MSHSNSSTTSSTKRRAKWKKSGVDNIQISIKEGKQGYARAGKENKCPLSSMVNRQGVDILKIKDRKKLIGSPSCSKIEFHNISSSN